MSTKPVPSPMPEPKPADNGVKPIGEGVKPSIEEPSPNIDPKPKLQTVETQIANSIKTTEEVKGGIAVVAINEGYFRNHRKMPGQKFNVPCVHMLGRWMECVEPEWEKERKKFLKDKAKYIEEESKKKEGR